MGITSILGGWPGPTPKTQTDPLLLPALARAGPDYSFLLPCICFGGPGGHRGGVRVRGPGEKQGAASRGGDAFFFALMTGGMPSNLKIFVFGAFDSK